MPPTASVRTYPPGSVFTTTWWVQVARYPLIAIVLVLTGAALWPRGAEASVDDLVADLRAGQVVEVEIGRDSAFGGALLGADLVRTPDPDDYRVRWRTTGDKRWRTFRTNTQSWADSGVLHDWQEPGDSSIELFSGTDPVLNEVADELARTPGGIELYSVRFGAHPAFVSWIVLAVWMIVLGTLIHGPQPRRVTRWGWFWLLLFTPYNLGFVALLALDAPWSRRAAALQAPLAHHEQRKIAVGDGRLTAARAIAVAVLASIVLGFVARAVFS